GTRTAVGLSHVIAPFPYPTELLPIRRARETFVAPEPAPIGLFLDTACGPKETRKARPLRCTLAGYGVQTIILAQKRWSQDHTLAGYGVQTIILARKRWSQDHTLAVSCLWKYDEI